MDNSKCEWRSMGNDRWVMHVADEFNRPVVVSTTFVRRVGSKSLEKSFNVFVRKVENGPILTGVYKYDTYAENIPTLAEAQQLGETLYLLGGCGV